MDSISDITPEQAQWHVKAPGRVNLIGEHIDYNDGWVMPIAIDRHVSIEAGPLDGRNALIRSIATGEKISIDLDAPLASVTTPWTRYVCGAIEEFRRKVDCELPGFWARIESTIPMGAGLSSSAALEVALVTLLEQITGHTLAAKEKALLCQRVEHKHVGVPCGLMDQMTSVAARANTVLLMDCVTNDCSHIPFDSDGIAVLIANTGVAHALRDGEYAARKSQSSEVLKRLGVNSYRDLTIQRLEEGKERLGDLLYRRGRHVLTEIERTHAATDALRASNWNALGRLLYESHKSLAEDYEVSCRELDTLVECCRALGTERGVYGSRMTGGGFGGCTITLVEKERLDDVTGEIERSYETAVGRKPDFFVTRSSEGVRVY